MMTTVAGVGLFVQAAGIQGGLGEHKSKGVAVRVSGLAYGSHPWHVTADATAKGVNPV